jgi:hypothetical protein
MPADLVAFMRWIGLLETAAQPRAPINWAGTWYTESDIPF